MPDTGFEARHVEVSNVDVSANSATVRWIDQDGNGLRMTMELSDVQMIWGMLHKILLSASLLLEGGESQTHGSVEITPTIPTKSIEVGSHQETGQVGIFFDRGARHGFAIDCAPNLARHMAHALCLD